MPDVVGERLYCEPDYWVIHDSEDGSWLAHVRPEYCGGQPIATWVDVLNEARRFYSEEEAREYKDSYPGFDGCDEYCIRQVHHDN